MTVGTPSIQVKRRGKGGPLLIFGSVTLGNGDTSIPVALSSHLSNILGMIESSLWTASAEVDVLAVDYSTTAGTITFTVTDPTADATLYFAVTGR